MIHIAPTYRATLAELSFETAAQIFGDQRLRVWRDLPDRDNSTLDATLRDGRVIRLHVKRDKHRRREPMNLEARGIGLLQSVGIATAPLVASGKSVDGRTFVITENLDDFLSADRLLETDVERTPIFHALADVAARLHRGRLHHRDLYANHFYLRPIAAGGYDVRLIDTARVRRLPMLFAERWIVKDVAQLLFSLHDYAADSALDAVLNDYCARVGRTRAARFERRVRAKRAWIDRHDAALRAKLPKRNLRLVDGN